MSRFYDRPLFRLALIGALVAALGLAACGRKGPLDPPPGASLAGEQTATPNPAANPLTSPIGGQASNNDQVLGPDGRPLAPKGEKKHIFLDDLLN